MRIRTIKPEFWTHPVMMRLDDESRLLAVALLNFSDDEGYFYAEAAVVGGALFPLKESTSVRRSIDDLSRIGYVEVRDHPTHGPVGRVVSFSDHQRVDRPKPSKIKELFDSTKNRRRIDDKSTEEQGTGNREHVLLSDSIGRLDKDDEILAEAWKSFPKKSRERSSKAQLKKSWRKLKPEDRPTKEQLVRAIGAWSKTDEWLKENGQFAPGAHLFLDRRKWEDEAPEPLSNRETVGCNVPNEYGF